VTGIVAHPLPSNLLEWHFVLEGGKGTEYEGGVYHGVMIFPSTYPYRPPSLQMLTPSGRFAVGQKICLSNTDFHAETWCARRQQRPPVRQHFLKPRQRCGVCVSGTSARSPVRGASAIRVFGFVCSTKKVPGRGGHCFPSASGAG
jgi:hypothetical protein